MRVSILGPLEVHGDGGRIEVRGSRLRALLARLALDAGRVVSVDALALGLWEDDSPTDVTNAIQSLVSRLRRLLPEPELLASRDGGYLLDVARDDVDAHRFQALAHDGREALRADDPATAADLLTRGLDLWRGEALADLRDAPYAAPTVAMLDQARAAAAEDRLDAEVRLGRGPDVLPELRAVVADDPLRERVVGLLVRALYDAGLQAEALEQYERTRSLLAERLGADPSPALQAIHLEVLRGAPVVASGSHPHNLRSTLTSFLGRDDELEQLGGSLTAHRLVTIVGPGGAGKTRLALEAAERRRSFGAVWVAELAPVTSPDDVAQAVLDAIDVRDVLLLEGRRLRPARDAMTQLEDVLSGGPCLLVIDNCEHLVDAGAQLAAHLLMRCPRLRILATSREPLGITGEVLHPSRRSVCHRRAPTCRRRRPRRRSRCSSTAPPPRLRASSSTSTTWRPSSRCADGSTGIPLAIELAAARLRTHVGLAARRPARRPLPPADRRQPDGGRPPPDPAGGGRVELGPAHRRRARRRGALLLFPGGATADAVARACLPAGSSLDEAEDALAALCDKSLVQLLATPDGGVPRYRMLETLREFGSERLAARGELLATRRAHARHYRSVAEGCEPLLREARQIDAVRMFDAEHDNLLAALRFAADDGDSDTAIRLAASLGWYWVLMDSHAEAATWMSVALDTPGSSDPGARALVTGLYAVNSVASGLTDLSDEGTMAGLLDGVPDVEPLGGHPLLAVVRPARASCRRTSTPSSPRACAAWSTLTPGTGGGAPAQGAGLRELRRRPGHAPSRRPRARSSSAPWATGGARRCP